MPHTAFFRCMNTEVSAWLWSANEAAARAALREVERIFREAHARFTRFETTSELSALNASSGQPFAASPDLFEVVEQALRFSQLTGGLFNPAIIGALEAAGYDRTFDMLRGSEMQRGPAAIAPLPRPLVCTQNMSAAPSTTQRAHSERSAAQSKNAPAAPLRVRLARNFPTTFAHTRPLVALDAERRTLTLAAGTRLDLGGIAKGWTVQRAAQHLSGYGPCLVDAGGDMLAIGAPPGESGWSIGVADPFDPRRDVAQLKVRDAALATSGADRRRWLRHGALQHHLIDPRTGLPSDSDLISVTIIAPTAVEAEVYAKATLLLGASEGLAYVEARPSLSALCVTRDGAALASSRLESHLDVRFVYDACEILAA